VPASDPEIILLRFSGEIATRAKPTRRRFEAQLLRDVRFRGGSKALLALARERHVAAPEPIA